MAKTGAGEVERTHPCCKSCCDGAVLAVFIHAAPAFSVRGFRNTCVSPVDDKARDIGKLNFISLKMSWRRHGRRLPTGERTLTLLAFSSASDRNNAGRHFPCTRSRKSSGGVRDNTQVVRRAGDVSKPAHPNMVLYGYLLGGHCVSGDLNGERFGVTCTRGDFSLAAPNSAKVADERHRLRSRVFPMANWESVLDDAADDRFLLVRSPFCSPMSDPSFIRSAVVSQVPPSDEEGASPTDDRRAMRDPARQASSISKAPGQATIGIRR